MFNDKTILKSQQRFKSDYHNVYTKQINQTAQSSNDDKRLQTLDKITIYFFSIKTEYNLHTNKQDYKKYIYI